MYNLKVGIKYYLLADIYGKKDEVTFILTMIDMNIPFNSINIYEVDSYFYDSYLSKISKDVSTKKKKGKLVLSFSYKALNTHVSFLLVEFCPKYNIKYLEVNFSTNNNSRNSIYIASIAGVTFIFLIIVIVFIYIKCKNKNIDKLALKGNSDEKPILSTSLSTYNSTSQYIPPGQQ